MQSEQDKNKAQEDAAIRLAAILRDNDYQALFAGGCVRDRLLDKTCKDYDIATDALPESVFQIFKEIKKEQNSDLIIHAVKKVGAHFGVILIKANGFDYEIATFRADGEYHDGRHPHNVRFSNPKEDAHRRDFTINSIFFDPFAKKTENSYIDYCGGIADLESKTIKAVGEPNKRFSEDHLRMLRAVRFAVELNFDIEKYTREAIYNNSNKIMRISAERIRDEIMRIFLHKDRLRGILILLSTGLLFKIIPEMREMRGCKQPTKFHPEGDVLSHTLLMLSLLREDAKLELILAVLLHDVGKAYVANYDRSSRRWRFNNHDKLGARIASKILERLRFPNKVIKRVCHCIDRHMAFKDTQNMRQSTLKRFMSSEYFDDELELHRVDCLGSYGQLDNWHFCRRKMREYVNEQVKPKPFVNGEDLISMKLKPGPIFKDILGKVYDMQLENKFVSREQALQYLRANLEKFSN